MVIKLICTGCSTVYHDETETTRCLVCNEPLELEEIRTGVIDYNEENWSLKRYKRFYPWFNLSNDANLGEGFTPLIEFKMEMGRVYIKNESANPTWSFKDRGTATGIHHALSKGLRSIGTVSTGNMAASVAAYGARAGMATVVLVKDEIAEEKLGPIAIYGARVIKVKGDYGALYRESIRIGNKHGIYFINSDSPFRVEGYKTTSFEIFEQLESKIPDYVLVPTSAGGNLRGIEKGFRELMLSGLSDRMPKFISVQAKGCNPIERGFAKGSLEIEKVDEPHTIAHAIENPSPPSGNQILRVIRRNGGMVVAVDDDEIIEAQGLMAQNGLFVQPASAAAVAACKKLNEEKKINKDDLVVCIATASGLKFSEALKFHKKDIISCSLENLEANLQSNL